MVGRGAFEMHYLPLCLVLVGSIKGSKVDI